MPEATGYNSTYLTSLQTLLNNGDYTGFWSSLAAHGDTYAEKAAAVTGATPTTPLEQMMQDLVQIHWDNTAGSGMYGSYFPAYALDHAQNYLTILTETGDFPSTTQIIDSYDAARVQVNTDFSVSLPKEVVFDGVWAAAQVGSEDAGVDHLPAWNVLVGMESARDDGTPDKGITLSTSLTVLAEDFLGLGEKYVSDNNAALANMAFNMYGKVLGLTGAVDNSSPMGTIPDPVQGCLTPWASAPTEASPLVIDLSSGHTGVELTTFDSSTTTTFFDIEGTGFATQTAWTSGDTGFLVDDLNSNGKIDSVSEMFGSQTVDGFAKLAAFDSNHDLKIDSSDANWSDLQVWVDSNGDGVTQSGELHSLASENIASIDLAGVASSSSTIDGNTISHTSTVTFTDDSTAAIDDAWFTHSSVNSYYNGDYTPDADTLFLPDLRGYGTIAEMSVAMSQDSTLKGMVSDFVDNFSTDGFSQTSLDSDVRDILFQWAGVQDVDPTSRGPNIDAQHLEFVEHAFDQGFLQWGYLADPYPYAAADIEKSFLMLEEHFKGELILQSGGQSLFTNTVTYNPWSDTTTGDTSLSETAIDALAAGAPSPGPDNVAYWVNVAQFIDAIKGIGNVTMTEAGWLDSTIASTDSSLSWSTISAQATDFDTLGGTPSNYMYGSGGGSDTVTGTSANDEITVYNGGNTVHGGIGNDTIIGSASGDTLYGDGGNDSIYGGAGADTLGGGTGGNYLYGYGGNDTYIYGGGFDYISENGLGGTEQIVMPSGVTLGDLSFNRVDGGGNDYEDLLITVAGYHTIQIQEQLNTSSPDYQIESILFSDTSTLDLSTITNPDVLLSAGGASFYTNTSTDLTIYGGNGGDTIAASSSSGNLTIHSGSGSDSIDLGTGNDTVIAGAGYDTISDAGGTDTIVIPTAYSMSDVTFIHPLGSPSYDLIVDIAGLGEIDLSGQFYSFGNPIENLHFLSDGSTIAIADQTVLVQGTTGNDTLNAPTFGVAGSVFYGNGGDDSFNGGAGDNTFNIASGFGTDYISEYATTGTNAIHFTGIDPAHIRMWTDSSGDLLLQDTTDTSHSITVFAATTGSGTDETAIDQYLAQITFDDMSHTVWNITGGLSLTANNSGQSIYGTAFGDTITGGTGADNLYGNGGNDILIGGAGNDAIDGGAGTDTISYAASGSGITVNLSTGTASGDGTDTLSNLENVIGSANADTITGDSNDNVLTGGAGNDTISGGNGNDTINGGAGNDTLAGGSNTDTLTYVDASSAITISLALTTGQSTGGSGTDTISGFENLTGSAYNDTLTGDGNANVIQGGDGNDTLAGGSGTDTVTYVDATAGVTVSLATASAQNTVGAGTDTISAFENLTGSSHDDTLTGDGNANVVHGGDGNDTIEGGAGNDTLAGDNGIDTLTYVSAGSAVTVNLSTATGQNTVGAGTDTISGFENLTGSGFNDTLTGDGNANVIRGGAGNDTISGGNGDDILVGGAGNDTITGGSGTDTVSYDDATAAVTVNLTTTTGQNTVNAGTDTISGVENLTGSAYNDTLTGDANANVIDGSAGNDTISAGNGNDTLIGGAGNDSLDGGSGTDTASYAAAASGVTVDLSAGTASGDGSDTLSNIENVTGSTHNDTFVSSTANNTFDGGAGTDTVSYSAATGGVTINLSTGSVTGHGTDTLISIENATGSTHNDTIVSSSADNVIDGGSGTDTVSYSAAAHGVVINLAAGTATGDGSDTLTSIENATGSSYDDTIVSSSVANAIDGGSGNDTVSYASASSAVTVNLSSGTATGDGSDTLTSIENVTGSTHADTITGSSAANIIDGGGGTDTIYGGSGADTFMFKAATALSASVTIEDFSKSAGDKIDISDVLAGHYDPLQNAINNFVQMAVSGSDTVIKVDIDGTGSAHTWQQVATIVGVTGLSASELVHDGNLIVS